MQPGSESSLLSQGGPFLSQWTSVITHPHLGGGVGGGGEGNIISRGETGLVILQVSLAQGLPPSDLQEKPVLRKMELTHPLILSLPHNRSDKRREALQAMESVKHTIGSQPSSSTVT